MTNLFAIAAAAALLILIAACSDSAQVNAEPTTPPSSITTSSITTSSITTSSTAPAATPTPTPTASATPIATETPEVLTILAEELDSLGISKRKVQCIRSGLDQQDADPASLEAAQLEAVILLDTIAQFCEVDLASYLEE
jgi:hypothetical protein